MFLRCFATWLASLRRQDSNAPVAQTDMKRFDLMHQINARGTFMVSKYSIAHLERAQNPHILMLSPPLDMAEKWFAETSSGQQAQDEAQSL
jgi:citronellol/citronellal dehydrogenase